MTVTATLAARKLAGAVAVGALVAVATVSTSNAATVTIGLREDGLGGITTVAGPTPSSASFSGTFGDYQVRVDGTAPPLLPAPGALNTNNLDISTNAAGSHFLDVFITAQAETFGAAVAAYFSAFTLNSTLGTVSTTMSTFLDPANGLFTTIIPLGSAGPFTTGPTTGTSLAAANCGGNCSITAQYHVVTTGPASSNATINVNAVPGPIVGAGLPGLLAACFGLIALARRRRMNAALA